MGAPTISSSAFNAFQPLCFARDPNGNVVMVNGLDRGARWDGLTSTVEQLGITAPTSAPTLADDTAAGAVTSSSSYWGYYRYLDNEFPTPVASSFSPPQTVATGSGATHRIDWSGFVQGETRCYRMQFWRTTADQNTVAYLIGTVGHNGTLTSEATSGGNCLFTLPAGHGLVPGAQFLLAGGDVAGYRTTHTVTLVTSTTVKTDQTHTANMTTSATWTLTGLTNDARTDDELQATNGAGGNISSSATSSGSVQYTVSSNHFLAVGDQIVVYDHSVAGYNGLQTVAHCPSTTTFVTDKTWTANGTGGTWAYSGDSRMAINNPDGSVNAYRFVVPPNFKAVCALFQDRMFYAADVEYTQGTVATNGTTTITGTSTSWTSAMVGRYIAIDGETKPYKISAYSSATSLTIDLPAATTASGKSYSIRPSQTELNQIYYSEPLEPESVPADNVVRLQNNTGDDDEIVGLMPFGDTLFVLQKRHIYSLAFVSQPRIDAAVALVAARGSVNNRTWVYFEDTAYLMDYSGIYKFSGGATVSVSDRIQDMFRDGTIDFSVAKWFFASKDPKLEVVRFHYAESGDTRPKHAICINHRTGDLWTESYPWELGGGSLVTISGSLRLALGGQDDIVYLSGQGTLDGTLGSGTVRGTATSSASTTLTDSAATFPTDIVGAYVAIVSGTGKGQERLITTRNSGTQFTVNSAWTTNPDTTSIYQIGAIPLTFRSGLLDLLDRDRYVDRRVRVIAQPTTNGALLDARIWFNHDAAARNFGTIPINQNDGVSTLANDPSATLDLTSTRSSLGNATGFWFFGLPGYHSERNAAADRWAAVELVGYQGADQLKVYGLELLGTQEDAE